MVEPQVTMFPAVAKNKLEFPAAQGVTGIEYLARQHNTPLRNGTCPRFYFLMTTGRHDFVYCRNHIIAYPFMKVVQRFVVHFIGRLRKVRLNLPHYLHFGQNRHRERVVASLEIG